MEKGAKQKAKEKVKGKAKEKATGDNTTTQREPAKENGCLERKLKENRMQKRIIGGETMAH